MLKKAGLVLGLVLFVLILALPPFESFQNKAMQLVNAQGTNAPSRALEAVVLAEAMRGVLALATLMIVWWLTEAIPLPATALLPAALLPILHLTGSQKGAPYEFTMGTVTANYANPVIFLFLGGFLLAIAMQKWGLDRRLTLWILTRGRLAQDSHHVLLGVMIVTAVLSMWISNTATAAMMLPLGLGILTFMGCKPGGSPFGTALMLGIAWSASIGGVGTLIGTPPNGIAIGILNSTFAGDPQYHRITFLDWTKFGVPYVIFFLPIAWWLLLRSFPPEIRSIPGGKERLLEQYTALGGFSAGEKRTLLVFGSAACLWIFVPFGDQFLPQTISRQIEWLDEYAIGILAGVILFCIPTNARRGKFVLDWSDARAVDWGTLILFGGGIALSDAMFKSGLASWLASSFTAVFGQPTTFGLMVPVVLMICFLTEITSNTAVTTMMVPIVISIARATGQDPQALSVATALAASMAFMLPVATPPNALVYGTGYVSLQDMVRAGVRLEILAWLSTVGVLVVFGSWLFGVIKL